MAPSVPYIQPADAVPAFGVPPRRGQTYTDMIPDTLDIQERCALAVNALTGATDPDRDYMLYFRANFSSNPPAMIHDDSDICQMKFMEALPLMRIASGSAQNVPVDEVWMRTALRMIGPDGLVYWPALPWARKPCWGDISPDEADQYAVPAFVGRALSAITAYMQRDPAGPWRAAGERVARALYDLAIHQDDFAFFPQGAFTPGGPRPRRAEMPIGIWSSLAGWTTQGLAQFYRASGFAPAGELAGKLARYIAYHGRYYGPAGEFLQNYIAYDRAREPLPAGVLPFEPGPRPERNYVHFQHHMVPLLGLLDYALAAGDAKIADFVRQSFEWARRQGNTTVGYFPENLFVNAEYEGSETCEVAGMIGLALKLSAAGRGDYWDDADRWIRNQFAENQLRRADWIYRVASGGLVWSRRRVPPSQYDPVRMTIDRVPERNVGAFAGWPSANDFFTGQGDGLMHCCTGNGARALYYIWEHILTRRDDELRVNLLLNRPSPWADVHSYLPFEGQVDVRMKEAGRLALRIPDWVEPAQTAATVDDRPRPIQWEERYAGLGQIAAGQVARLTFPIAERVQHADIEKAHYILTLKGHDVVAIDPPGRFCPYYQRDVYRENVVRWRKATRFVSAESLYW